MPLAAFVALLLTPTASAVFDFESMFDEASKLYDYGNPKAALPKLIAIKAKYPNEYKGVRLYHMEVALAADEKQGRIFAQSLIKGAFATDWASLAGVAPAVEHLKKAAPETWNLALTAAKKAVQLNPKSAEAQEAMGICYVGLKQKPLAKKSFTAAIALAKKDPNPDTVWIQWLDGRRKKVG